MRRTDSIEVLKGIGKSRAEAFAKLGIHTVGDLLEDYPARYEEMPPAAPIASFGEGRMAAVCCTLSSAPRLVSTAKGALAVVSVTDGSARLSLGWFNQPYMAKILKKGDRRVFRGVILRRTNGLSMMQPQVFSEEEYAALAGRPRPVYLTVKGLPVNTIRQAARQALAGAEDLQDLLPESIRQANALCSFEEALWGIHAPQSLEQLRQAHNRLVFDEFLAFILRCRLLRAPEKIPNTFPVEQTA